MCRKDATGTRTRGRIARYCWHERDSQSDTCSHRRIPRDQLSAGLRFRQRVDDYLGTEHVWVVDPELRKAYVCSKTGMQEPENGVLTIPGTEIRVVLSELFAEPDQA